MTKDKLKEEVYSAMINKPDRWREGQFVFNYIEAKYSSEITRGVQFEDKVDCFYEDSEIDDFIEKCSDRINKIAQETGFTPCPICGSLNIIAFKSYDNDFEVWCSDCDFTKTVSIDEDKKDILEQLKEKWK